MLVKNNGASKLRLKFIDDTFVELSGGKSVIIDSKYAEEVKEFAKGNSDLSFDSGISQGEKPVDFSVNQARSFINHQGSLVFYAHKKNTGQVAGNFQGGGTGNKPIAGFGGYEGLPIERLPHILAEVELHSRPTGTDSDEVQHGLAFNVLIDLNGNGNPADYKVISISNNLNGIVDKYAKSGISASITDFNIAAFEVLANATTIASPNTPVPYTAGEKAPYLKNHFYVVGGLSTYVNGTNLRTDVIVDNTWPGIPMNLSVLLNGGTMPMTGAQFTSGYPNCKIISVVAFDGGHPAAMKLPGLIAQIGDSSLALKTVTAVTQLSIGGVNMLPNV